jgi:hypothetical protein
LEGPEAEYELTPEAEEVGGEEMAIPYEATPEAEVQAESIQEAGPQEEVEIERQAEEALSSEVEQEEATLAAEA